MHKLFGGVLGIIVSIFPIYQVRAQEIPDAFYVPDVVIKTNLLYDATTTLNLGFEFYLSRKLTFDLPFNYNSWILLDDKEIKHWLVQPELRYWLNRSFKGSFLGLHAHGGQFNTANVIDRYRYEGWLAGAGISFGHRWNFSRKWAMELTIGAGYAYIDYTKYSLAGMDPEGCETCGRKLMSDNKNYWGITKVGLSLSYTLGQTIKNVSVTDYSFK
ncbi:hypothetical protein FACS1894155_09530 [Bacteroidia bacterium]|nr:hypothetical protein FACS1894155_09530 [Bacteroidia bacterium]